MAGTQPAARGQGDGTSDGAGKDEADGTTQVGWSQGGDGGMAGQHRHGKMVR